MPRPKGSKNKRVAKEGYSFGDLLGITTADANQIQHWARHGVVKPDLSDPAGTGYPRRYSSANAIEIQICSDIATFTSDTEQLYGIADHFRAFHRKATAFYDESIGAPLRTDLFDSARVRGVYARMFVTHEQISNGELGKRLHEWFDSRGIAPIATSTDPLFLKPVPEHKLQQATPVSRDVEAALQKALKVARAWAYIRTGPFSRGDADPEWMKCLWLFTGPGWAEVLLDPSPEELRDVVGNYGTPGMFVDLADCVFQVARRAAQRGYPTLGVW